MRRDADAQPPEGVNRLRRADRDLAEMLGLAKGVLFDGAVTDEEATAILRWAEDHPEVVMHWPGKFLYRRLRTIFADGKVTAEEREDLAELLNALVGKEAGMLAGQTTSATLPFDDPAPLIEVPDRVFVLTGRFAFGPRDACVEATRTVGGWCEDQVTLSTDFLVVGTFGSRDWAQTPFGRKIEKAAEYREKHGRPAIISEDRWASEV